MRYKNTFGDFDFESHNDTWVLNIHDCADNDNIIVVDYCHNNDEEELYPNQMIFSTKEMFKEVLEKFFSFNEKEIQEILDEIKEI